MINRTISRTIEYVMGTRVDFFSASHANYFVGKKLPHEHKLEFRSRKAKTGHAFRYITSAISRFLHGTLLIEFLRNVSQKREDNRTIRVKMLFTFV